MSGDSNINDDGRDCYGYKSIDSVPVHVDLYR